MKRKSEKNYQCFHGIYYSIGKKDYENPEGIDKTNSVVRYYIDYYTKVCLLETEQMRTGDTLVPLKKADYRFYAYSSNAKILFYYVSSSGIIKACLTDKSAVVVNPIERSGYYVRLYLNNQRVEKPVHYIVAECFVPNPNHYKYVGHKDGDLCNNDESNLYWCEKQQNQHKTSE